MAFAFQLRDSLRLRDRQAPREIANGDTLNVVLTRYLTAIEATTDNDMLTSILLLENGQLTHGAAPNLPDAYRAAIDGVQIGPSVGSCGTAAHFARPIYVADIATDPLWTEFRDVALQHGLRACWSTPIFNHQGAVIGTFAVYHLSPRGPTHDEVEAIRTITDHVARAIMWSIDNDIEGDSRIPPSLGPVLKLAVESEDQSQAELPEGHPGPDQFELADKMGKIARDFEALSRMLDLSIEALSLLEPDSEEVRRLRKAKKASDHAAALARASLPPE